MHNLDNSFSNYNAGGSQREWEYDGEQDTYGSAYEWENGNQLPGAGDYENEYARDDAYNGEYEQYEGEFEDEIALASELLAVNNEYELDQFFGKLGGWLKRGYRGARNLAKKAGVYDMVANSLKSVAKAALPVAAKVVGGVVGGPAGSALASAGAEKAASMLGLELEGLSPEDQEFEVARRFVQFANEAMNNVAYEDDSLPPQVQARQAVEKAAQTHAPGLLAPAPPPGRTTAGVRQPQQGRWVRQGKNILLLNTY